jgi:hypothetical protein
MTFPRGPSVGASSGSGGGRPGAAELPRGTWHERWWARAARAPPLVNGGDHLHVAVAVNVHDNDVPENEDAALEGAASG